MSKIKWLECAFVLESIAAFLLFISGYRLIGCLGFALWYLLRGFLDLAYFFMGRKLVWISKALTFAAFPYTLLPYRRALYYLMRAWYAVGSAAREPSRQKNERILALLGKCNSERLDSDLKRILFYMFQAAALGDLGRHDEWLICIERAASYPHPAQVDEMLNQLRDNMKAQMEDAQ